MFGNAIILSILLWVAIVALYMGITSCEDRLKKIEKELKELKEKD